MKRLVPLIIVQIVLAGWQQSWQQGWYAGAAGAQPRRDGGRVRVAAAADLQYALPAVAARLAGRAPAIDLAVTYGSSGNFHAQLRQRAPFDVYLSADVGYPEDLVARGIGSDADLFTYARGRLVVWVPNGSTLPIDREGIRAVAGARRIAIANPRHAPYGRAAEAVLRKAGLWSQVEPRLLLGENIAQAAQFVRSGGAAAGILARSLAVAPAMRGAGRYVDIAEGDHPPLLQGGLVLPWAASRDAAHALRDFLLGAEGRDLLAAHGFAPAG